MIKNLKKIMAAQIDSLINELSELLDNTTRLDEKRKGQIQELSDSILRKNVQVTDRSMQNKLNYISDKINDLMNSDDEFVNYDFKSSLGDLLRFVTKSLHSYQTTTTSSLDIKAVLHANKGRLFAC